MTTDQTKALEILLEIGGARRRRDERGTVQR